MDHHHGSAILRPVLDIVHVKRAALIIIDGHIIGHEAIIGQVLKAFIGGFVKPHKSNLNVEWEKVNKVTHCMSFLIGSFVRLTRHPFHQNKH